MLQNEYDDYDIVPLQRRRKMKIEIGFYVLVVFCEYYF